MTCLPIASADAMQNEIASIRVDPSATSPVTWKETKLLLSLYFLQTKIEFCILSTPLDLPFKISSSFMNSFVELMKQL
jgi:hypothetical protein